MTTPTQSTHETEPPRQHFLTVEDVARLLHCSVDKVLRIPRNQLPVYSVGKENLYFYDDVIRYVRVHCRKGNGQEIDDPLDDL